MAKGSATPKRKTIFPDFLTLSGGTRKAFLLLERRIQKTVFIFAGDFLIFRLPAGRLADRSDSAAVPLFYIAEKAMRKEGTRFCQGISGCQPVGYSSFVGRFPAASRRVILLSSEDVRQLAGGLFFFRRKMSGSLPEGYSSFVGRCPAASRKAILLSPEDVRQLAGGLFFFRRRKKNQERRHPFEGVDADQRTLSSGLLP